MHLLVEVISLLLILVLLKRGWQAGFVITCLRFGQVSLAILLTFLAGRYLGNAIVEWAYRPRIITIPNRLWSALSRSISLNFALCVRKPNAQKNPSLVLTRSSSRPALRTGHRGLTAAILLPILLWAGQLSATCFSTDIARTLQKSWSLRQSSTLIETGLYL